MNNISPQRDIEYPPIHIHQLARKRATLKVKDRQLQVFPILERFNGPRVFNDKFFIGLGEGMSFQIEFLELLRLEVDESGDGEARGRCEEGGVGRRGETTQVFELRGEHSDYINIIEVINN